MEKGVLLDERKSRKLLRLICCLRLMKRNNSINTGNLLYIIMVYTILFVVIVQSIILAYITDDIVEKVESIHYTLVMIIIIAYISNELYNSENLNNAQKLMTFAYATFNDYNKEKDQVHFKISSNAMESNRIFCFLMSGSCMGYLLFSPIRHMFASEEYERKLPFPLYMPFDTKENVWFVVGMIWEALTLFYMFGVATSVHQSFRGIMGRLRGELTLLNQSIERIYERAAKKYKCHSNFEIFHSDPEFNFHLYGCLRDDIIHHQLLLKYYSLTKNYLGTILLLFIFLSSIILAAVGFLITRPNSHMEDIIKFLAIVSAELFFVYQLCWEGEMVAEESGKIFSSLFNIPWYQSERNFKIALNIYLCGTKKPIRLRTSVFNVVASLETYNSVITTAFQYFNILRNIKSNI